MQLPDKMLIVKSKAKPQTMNISLSERLLSDDERKRCFPTLQNVKRCSPTLQNGRPLVL